MTHQDDGVKEYEGKKRKSSIKVKNADRAMDNMFRITLNNHLQLSAMADNKANMLITVCSLIITLSLANFSDPSLQPTILSMGMTCLITILLAVYATVPNLPPKIQGRIDPRAPSFNILFFGHFSQLEFATFKDEMEQVVNNKAIVYESLAKDLYNLGKILSERKYRFLRYSYVIFMIGLVVSALVLVITYPTSGAPAQM